MNMARVGTVGREGERGGDWWPGCRACWVLALVRVSDTIHKYSEGPYEARLSSSNWESASKPAPILLLIMLQITVWSYGRFRDRFLENDAQISLQLLHLIEAMPTLHTDHIIIPAWKPSRPAPPASSLKVRFA
jgi:hypothetical protein